MLGNCLFTQKIQPLHAKIRHFRRATENVLVRENVHQLYPLCCLRRKRNRNQTEFCFEYLPRHQSFFVYLLVITDIKGEINDIWLFQYQSNVRRFMCLSDDYVGNVSKFSELKNSQFRLNRDNVVIADNFSPYLWRNNIINVLFIWHMLGNCVNCQVLKKFITCYRQRAPLLSGTISLWPLSML